ncbi:hypothetical protein P152DRAFT_450175 [Eremomyces bilateralis CBS 781.70]|uniref:Uncharacterized protein n=1 Tax=Eremomyces bilateralis CBS 781.70 TaxID=1392243 RepID=A0A6G1G0B1_9PEZI|nr:uncharacterized protein P152DRAFT_450175 [Eremomyces bilateralis CBS 781.70]KAF1811458.1 hypothetical protein P152DRAFT_450175 [Eremomyces bilateralis CBS 781.70]
MPDALVSSKQHHHQHRCRRDGRAEEVAGHGDDNHNGHKNGDRNGHGPPEPHHHSPLSLSLPPPSGPFRTPSGVGSCWLPSPLWARLSYHPSLQGEKEGEVLAPTQGIVEGERGHSRPSARPQTALFLFVKKPHFERNHCSSTNTATITMPALSTTASATATAFCPGPGKWQTSWA